jgi:hypothetical protein
MRLGGWRGNHALEQIPAHEGTKQLDFMRKFTFKSQAPRPRAHVIKKSWWDCFLFSPQWSILKMHFMVISHIMMLDKFKTTSNSN